MYYLYWIHLPFHSDPFSEGYIGVTKDPERRKDEHLRKSDRFPPGSLFITLAKLPSFESAQCVEFYLRPKWYIGWNIAQGGQDGNRPPGIHTSGWKWNEESKKKRAELWKGNTHGNKETVVEGVVFPSQKEAAKHLQNKYGVAFTRAKTFLREKKTLDWLLTDQRKFNGDGSLFRGYERGRHKKRDAAASPKTAS